MAMRSRAVEAEALLDPAGLGAFSAVEWSQYGWPADPRVLPVGQAMRTSAGAGVAMTLATSIRVAASRQRPRAGAVDAGATTTAAPTGRATDDGRRDDHDAAVVAATCRRSQ